MSVILSNENQYFLILSAFNSLKIRWNYFINYFFLPGMEVFNLKEVHYLFICLYRNVSDDYHSSHFRKRIIGNKSSIFNIFQLSLLNNDHDIQHVHVKRLSGIFRFILFLNIFLYILELKYWNCATDLN